MNAKKTNIFIFSEKVNTFITINLILIEEHQETHTVHALCIYTALW